MSVWSHCSLCSHCMSWSKVPLQLSCSPFKHWKATVRSSWSLLFSRTTCPVPSNPELRVPASPPRWLLLASVPALGASSFPDTLQGCWASCPALGTGLALLLLQRQNLLLPLHWGTGTLLQPLCQEDFGLTSAFTIYPSPISFLTLLSVLDLQGESVQNH